MVNHPNRSRRKAAPLCADQEAVVHITVKIEMTEAEAEALLSAAEAGTIDDAIDNLGWSAAKKATYRQAHTRLSDALRAAKP